MLDRRRARFAAAQKMCFANAICHGQGVAFAGLGSARAVAGDTGGAADSVLHIMVIASPSRFAASTTSLLTYSV